MAKDGGLGPAGVQLWSGDVTKLGGDQNLQHEVRQLTAAIQQLAYEHQRVLDELDRMREAIGHVQQNEQHEREKMSLRLENEMLKFERRLPPREGT